MYRFQYGNSGEETYFRKLLTSLKVSPWMYSDTGFSVIAAAAGIDEQTTTPACVVCFMYVCVCVCVHVCMRVACEH